jgi:hypothetical protein
MDDWIRIVGPGADTRRPKIGAQALCWDETCKRLFVGAYDMAPGRGSDFVDDWYDEECTHVPVTHWQAVEPPRG